MDVDPDPNCDVADDETLSAASLAITTEGTRQILKHVNRRNHDLVEENEFQAKELAALERDKEEMVLALATMKLRLPEMEQAAQKPRRTVQISLPSAALADRPPNAAAAGIGGHP